MEEDERGQQQFLNYRKIMLTDHIQYLKIVNFYVQISPTDSIRTTNRHKDTKAQSDPIQTFSSKFMLNARLIEYFFAIL